ncbi:MAG: PKD domain-containing protein, partial [Trueperaceae bacterium]|nr:PKD domain-containing protein [Trueperaceae bacterium]
DGVSCVLDVGDGSSYEVGSCGVVTSRTHAYAGAGSYDVSLVASDPEGAEGEATGSVVVTSATDGVDPNGAPVVESLSVSPSEVGVGSVVTFAWRVVDPDGDGVSCVLDVGDGSSYEVGACGVVTSRTHAYVGAGSYDVSLEASDPHDATGDAATVVDVIAFDAVAGGASFSLALDAAGDAWAWGSDGNGQVGNGGVETADRSTPQRVRMPEGVTFVALAAGDRHAVALDADGRAWAWGNDASGRLGDGGTNEDQDEPVQVDLPDGVTVTRVVAGSYHTLALDADGKAWAWGDDGQGQLGDGGSNEDRAVPVEVDMPAGVSFTDLAAGQNHSLALDHEGRAWAWGWNGNGQLGIGGVKGNQSVPTAVIMPAETSFTDLAAGYGHSLAVDATGAAWAWGWNADGQLGIGNQEKQNQPTAVSMPANTSFTKLVAGRTHSLSVDADGAVWAWGDDGNGRLGDGTGSASQSTPVGVEAPWSDAITSLSAGRYHSLAVDASGRAWAWGSDTNGRLGNGGADEDASTPTAITIR